MSALWQNSWMAGKAKTKWYLRQWRKHRGYTQDRLAEMTGISKGYISQLEIGTRQYTQELLELFAEHLRCAPADLIIRNPEDPEGLWSIYDQLTAPERTQAVSVIRAIKGTGTHG